MAQLNYTKANASQDGSQVILNYTPLIYGNLAYSLAFTNANTIPFQSSFLNLGGTSGSPHSEYFLTTLQVPQPGDNLGYIRRLVYYLRFTSTANQDAFPLPASLGINAPSFAICNLSNGQVFYGGFKAQDLYSYDYDVGGAKPSSTYPLGAIKMGCVPFFASPNDNVQLVCISGSNDPVYGALQLQFANFDLPVYKDVVTNGWVESN